MGLLSSADAGSWMDQFIHRRRRCCFRALTLRSTYPILTTSILFEPDLYNADYHYCVGRFIRPNSRGQHQRQRGRGSSIPQLNSRAPTWQSQEGSFLGNLVHRSEGRRPRDSMQPFFFSGIWLRCFIASSLARDPHRCHAECDASFHPPRQLAAQPPDHYQPAATS
jgi:hypothetical protein